MFTLMTTTKGQSDDLDMHEINIYHLNEAIEVDTKTMLVTSHRA